MNASHPTPDDTPEASDAASAATPRGRAPVRNARSRAREFALQGLYQVLVGRNEAPAVDTFTRDLAGFSKSDAVHYDALLYGCAEQAEALDRLIEPLLDRPLAEISPIEHATMWMGVYEFQHCLDVPWRVVLNEYIELSKRFGGTDGHKYVNGVLNGLAPQLRATEVAADRAHVRARK